MTLLRYPRSVQRSDCRFAMGCVFRNRPFIMRCLLIPLWIGLGGLPASMAFVERPVQRSPNILLFMADDLTYSDLGCYGNPDVRTRAIDEFATQALKFNRCFNSAPMCSPLRQSLMTGIYPVRNGAYPNHSQVYPDIQSLPHYLQTVGYRTAILGKRHEAPAEAFPFESLGGRHHDNGKGVDLELSKVDKFLRQQAESSKPFCLFVTSNQPHRPWNRGDAKAYNPDALTVPPYLIDTPETRQALCDYYAEITYLDQQFQHCLDALKETSLDQNTVVIFLSEQGSNFPFCKWTCYSMGIRSACLIRWPGVIPSGSDTNCVVSYVDIVPTLVHLAGIESDRLGFDGQSLLDVLKTGKTKPRKAVFAIQTSRGIYNGPEAYGIRAATDGRYLLIHNLNHQTLFSNSVVRKDGVYASWEVAGKAGQVQAARAFRRYQKRPEFELFDLEQDPWNQNNIADRAEHSEIKDRLFESMQAWMLQQGDQGVATEESATLRQVKRSSK